MAPLTPSPSRSHFLPTIGAPAARGKRPPPKTAIYRGGNKGRFPIKKCHCREVDSFIYDLSYKRRGCAMNWPSFGGAFPGRQGSRSWPKNTDRKAKRETANLILHLLFFRKVRSPPIFFSQVVWALLQPPSPPNPSHAREFI